MTDTVINAENLTNTVVNEEAIEATNENVNVAEEVVEVNTEFGVPVGSYSGEITGASTWRHKDGGHDVVRIDVTLRDIQYLGHTVTKYFNLSSKEAAQCFSREMAGLGVTVSKREDVAKVPKQLLGMIVRVKIVPSNKGNHLVHLSRTAQKSKQVQFDPNSVWI